MHSSGFRELLLRPELLRAIVDCGFEHPSEVQHECIPEAILGNDILCQAKSGMGKTAVFVLSVLQQLDVKAGDEYNGVQTVVLCHTRELAFQICHEFDRFKKYLPQVRTAVFYGGVALEKNVQTLKEEKPHIVIGTPGRMLALVDGKHLDLSKLKQFVLDECDKLLEQLDMRRDVQRIFKATPHEKQVMMFSATLSAEVRPVCKKFMHNPHEIYVNEGAKLTLHGLQQYYVQLDETAKNRKLVDLLDALQFNQLIIFVKSVSRATALNKLLVECNFPAIAIHGNLKQEQRYVFIHIDDDDAHSRRRQRDGWKRRRVCYVKKKCASSCAPLVEWGYGAGAVLLAAAATTARLRARSNAQHNNTTTTTHRQQRRRQKRQLTTTTIIG